MRFIGRFLNNSVIFRDRFTLLATAVVMLTAAVISFSLASDLPEEKPLIGVFLFGLLPILAFAGLVVSYFAVRSEGSRGDE